MNVLPGEKARINTAKWILMGYAVFAVVGTFLHIVTRFSRKDTVEGLYIALMLTIGVAALYARSKLALSLSRAMTTFAWLAMVCLVILIWYSIQAERPYERISFLFHVGILSLGFVLGFRPAIQYAIATSVIFVLLGIIYPMSPGDIVIPIFFAFALALPSKVIEQLIEQSTAELSAINLQLEELVEARTAELRAEIAERRHAQEVLSRRTTELEKRNEELDAYAHTVAHDLKSPLATIIGFSDLIEKRYEKFTADKLSYYCSIIAQNSRKIINIVDSLLLLASVRKVEDVPIEGLDLSEVIEDIQRRLGHTITERGAEIIAPDLWPTVMSYQPWVEEILVNYISNAIQYGGTPPRVEIGVTGPTDGHVRFWVRDNGKGLTPEEQARLFTPFTRLDQVRVKGHGLGLSIVQRIAEKLNGEVGVESQVGQGCTFYLTLPLVKSERQDVMYDT